MHAQSAENKARDCTPVLGGYRAIKNPPFHIWVKGHTKTRALYYVPRF